jgi:MOSC domain-containing protein YiiM
LLPETLKGDVQVNPKYHGGKLQAVYAYEIEHYSYWREKFPDRGFPFGFFGENLTTEGLSDEHVFIGNTYAIGSCQLQVTRHRMPCSKLVARAGITNFYNLFVESSRHGFYFRVLKTGYMKRGDQIRLLEKDPRWVTVPQYARALEKGTRDSELLARILSIPSISPADKAKFSFAFKAL